MAELETPPESWPSMSQVMLRFGLSKKAIQAGMAAGALNPRKGPKIGSRSPALLFDPAELEALLEQDAGEDESFANPTTADVVRASVEGMKQAQAHAHTMIRALADPIKDVMQVLRDENTALRADNEKLRAERKELEVLREETRASKAIEDLALAELKGDQQTKQDALDLAKPIVKHFINAALLKGGVDPKLIALKNAVESIPRGTYEALFASGILPDEITEQLKMGLGWEDKKEPAP